jgi:hypothetical protein
MLHSGKAADELGLTAEHFKNSPSIVWDDWRNGNSPIVIHVHRVLSFF